MWHKLEELFGIDLRSLAFFRISIALLLLFDLFNRSKDITAHYTDLGVLPREALPGTKAWLWSIHWVSGSWEVQAFLFGAAAVFGAMLLVGYRTRLSNIISWYLLCSLHVRNPLVLQGGDVLFKLLLFWGMFLPLGARCSVDSWQEATLKPKRILSVGSAALLLQVCFVYWFSIAYKWNPSWFQGQSVSYALSIEQFATPLGIWLREYASVLPILTHLTFWTELLIPFVAFIPVYTSGFRLFVVGVFVTLHVGFSLFLELGLFPYVSMASWIPFLPSQLWDRFQVARPIKGRDSSSWVENGVAAVLLVYVFAWNLSVTGLYQSSLLPGLKSITGAFHVRQEWNMFSDPLRQDGWYVIPAKLANGETVDLFRGGESVSWDKPSLVSTTYKNQRWRKYLMNLFRKSNHRFLPYYAEYLSREWDRRRSRGQQLEMLQIVFMLAYTREEEKLPHPQKKILWTHLCQSSRIQGKK